ncbi:MAG: hypothetical protein ABIN74_15285 [Ferruginibacter sp.]
MITEEKIKQARKQLRSGIPQGEIKNDLRKEGYTDEDIDKVFVAYKPDMRSWYLFFAIVFFIAGIWLFTLSLVAASAIMFSLYYVEWRKARKK